MEDYSKIRGFNYQPSYGYNSFENWMYFKPDIFELELRRGKEYFPKMNAVRLWLSYYAFKYEPKKQVEYFEQALSICEKLGLKAMPILFNCWHDATLDNGGIYFNHMIPGSSWVHKDNMYDDYIEKIVGTHNKDERIIAWDICNEPFSYGNNKEIIRIIEPYESQWLRQLYDMCKQVKATQPVSFSHASVKPEEIEKMLDIEDIIFIHPYYFYSDEQAESLDPNGFDDLLKIYTKMAKRNHKQVLTTETCWGLHQR